MHGVTRSCTHVSTFGFASGGARHGETHRNALEAQQFGDADAQQGAVNDWPPKHVNKASLTRTGHAHVTKSTATLNACDAI